MISIIYGAKRDVRTIPPDHAPAFERGHRAVQSLVGKSYFGGDILQRPAEFDSAAVGANIEDEVVPHPLARRADITLLDTGTQVHDLTCKRCGEGLCGLRITFKRSEHLPPRIDPHRAFALAIASQ